MLLRVGAGITRRAVREAKRVAGVRCSVQPVRNVVGVANYLFKHTKRPERKAELTPANFRGRMYTVSKGFLTKPFKDLWQGGADWIRGDTANQVDVRKRLDDHRSVTNVQPLSPGFIAKSLGL